MNKQIQENMKESDVSNNTNTHGYMQAVVKVMFKNIHTNKGINLFRKRDKAKTIKK